MAMKPTTVNKHILNIVVGCTEIPFFTVRCMQSFDLSRKFITLIVRDFWWICKRIVCLCGAESLSVHAISFFFQNQVFLCCITSRTVFFVPKQLSPSIKTFRTIAQKLHFTDVRFSHLIMICWIYYALRSPNYSHLIASIDLITQSHTTFHWQNDFTLFLLRRY